MRRCILAVAALAGGCIEIPAPFTYCRFADPDHDHDGWRCDGVVPDCDDDNGKVNPGAVEVPGDGIDNDCDGIDLDPTAYPDPKVSVDTSNGLRVIMPHWTMGFGASGNLLPDSLVDDATGVDWLSGDGIGDDITPGFTTASGVTGTERGAPLAGPVIAAVELSWQADNGAVLGESSFAFGPDDVILRQDFFSVQAPIMGAGPYDASSFVDLDATQFEYAWWPGLADPVTTAGTSGVLYQGAADQAGAICLDARSDLGEPFRDLRASWLHADTLGPTLTGGSTLRFGVDWERAASTVPATLFDATTRLAYDADVGCAGGPSTREIDFQSPPRITPHDSTVLSTGGLGDLDHDGFDESKGYVSLDGGDHVVFTVDEIASQRLLVRATIGTDPPGVTVWLQRGAGAAVRLREHADYYYQRVGPGTGDGYASYVVQLTGVVAGDTYTFAAPGAEP